MPADCLSYHAAPQRGAPRPNSRDPRGLQKPRQPNSRLFGVEATAYESPRAEPDLRVLEQIISSASAWGVGAVDPGC
jgi:hypothetical protein